VEQKGAFNRFGDRKGGGDRIFCPLTEGRIATVLIEKT